jgi:biotin carboxyl carrier protein
MNRERVQQVIAMLKASGSAELSVRDGDLYIRVRRAPKASAPAPIAPAAAPGSLPVAAPTPTEDTIIRARLVGRFYHGKGLGQPPLVRVGDRVKEGQVIATIEALGKITGVPATVAGEVIEFLAEDGAAVGYGTPLIRLKRVE